jgi:hypothetical protein
MGRAFYAYRIQKSSVVSTLHARHNTRRENNSAVSVNNLNDLARDAPCQTAGHFLEFLEQGSFNQVALLASDDSHWLTRERLLADSARTCAGGATPSSGTRFAWLPLRTHRCGRGGLRFLSGSSAPTLYSHRRRCGGAARRR